MTNRAKQKKGRGYQRKSEPIIQRDNNDGMRHRQPAIPVPINRVEHDSWSFTLRLLHDPTRNLTLPKATHQPLPGLPLNSQPNAISFMDIPTLYRPDLAVEPLNVQVFFAYSGTQHILCHHTITRCHASGAAFCLDDPTREAPEDFADTGWQISGLRVEKKATWQRPNASDILKPGTNQGTHFARMASIKWSETATQCDTAQQPGAQFAHGFFWPTLFCLEK